MRSSSLPLASRPASAAAPGALPRDHSGHLPARPVVRAQAMQQTQEPQSGSRQAPARPTPSKTLHSFFYFDPQDPEHLVEVQAAGAGSSHTAPLQLVSGSGSRSLSKRPANGGSQEDVGSTQKALVMQQEVMAQLEHTRGKVQELQQFESSSREWRMRAQQAAAELLLFQRTLADKDAELASAYKRLESAAAERSALRKLNLALDEEARSLKGIVDEVRLLEAAAGPDKAGQGQGQAAGGATATAATGSAGEPPKAASPAAEPSSGGANANGGKSGGGGGGGGGGSSSNNNGKGSASRR